MDRIHVRIGTSDRCLRIRGSFLRKICPNFVSRTLFHMSLLGWLVG